MNWDLLWFIAVGGISVLISYSWYWMSESPKLTFKNLAGPFTGDLLSCSNFSLWSISVLITVASYLYITIVFIWEEDVGGQKLSETQKRILYPSYMLFLINAVQYVFIASIDILLSKKSQYLQINLMLTAVGSIGFLFTTLTPDTIDWWLVVASGYIVIHHLFLDAIWWYSGFLKSQIRNYSAVQRTDNSNWRLNL